MYEEIERDIMNEEMRRQEGINRSFKELYKCRYPVPEGYDALKIMKALEKLDQRNDPKLSDAALLPLTPGERGYVLGILTARKES